MDLDSFLTELYVMIDTWQQTQPVIPRPGRPPRLSLSEALTLAVVAQWPRWRSERDFWRYADRHLRGLFPALPGQSQLNRRIRRAEPALRAVQTVLAAQLTDPAAGYHLLDTTLIPAIQRVRAARHGLFAGEAAFGRCAAKTAWVYGFKLGVATDPAGVITTFGVASPQTDERPIGDALIAADRFPVYLADKGFAGRAWEQRWQVLYGAQVAATPKRSDVRAWPDAACRWAAGKRQLIEGVFDQLKDLFGLDRHRAKTLAGLLARVAAKILAYTCGQALNRHHARPLRHLADLLL